MRSLQDHFLIAMPAMADPNFTQTVTYICKHDTEGAFGIVINRPSDLSLGEMLGQLSIDLVDRTLIGRPVLHGGPVEPERGFVIHRSERPFEATLEIGQEIKLTSSPDILAALGRGTGPEPFLVDTPFEQRWTAALGLPGVDIQRITDYAGHA
jgi:putative transcriptional regulator